MDITWLEIDTKAIIHNINEAKKLLKKNVKICAVVKDDAYGHGLLAVSKALIKNGVECLGVCDISEGKILRDAGITKPIINLASILKVQIPDAIKYEISQSISNLELAKQLDHEAGKQKKIAKVHIEIDTGMGRLGVVSKEFDGILKETLKLANVRIEGVFTHLACADSDADYTFEQVSDFEFLSLCVPDEVTRHILNSSGIINYPEAAFDMVRPGLMIYGYYNNEEERKIVKLEPALSWKTKVLLVKKFKKGAKVSYGGTYTVKKDTEIAILAVGYGDGYNRLLSNRGEVIINGKKYPVVGKVCMDLTMVELGRNSKVMAGDEVILIGKSGRSEITAEEIAEKLKTIPYEVTCAINKGLKRIYS